MIAFIALIAIVGIALRLAFYFLHMHIQGAARFFHTTERNITTLYTLIVVCVITPVFMPLIIVCLLMGIINFDSPTHS